MSPRILEPRRLPLQGIGLIEASAGTGKTYTIVALYLRLLLEKGLDLDRILVVTFTNAATEELRSRIRRRIVEALDALEAGSTADALLADLIDRLPDPGAARRHLADTLARLDEAAVYTIHGFCQRMLQDNAFESRVAFEAEFVTDESELRRTVVCDFWRRRAASMDNLQARWLRSRWNGPEALLETLQPLLRDPRIRIVPDPADLAAAGDLSTLAGAFAALKTAWAANRDTVVKILETDEGLNRRSYTKTVVRSAIDAMDAMLGGDVPLVLPDHVARFTPGFLAQKTKSGHQCPHHAFFDRCGAFAEVLESALRAETIRFLAEARAYLSTELARRKRQRQILFFDDLLRLMDESLDGPDGARLAAAIRKRFPAALIDEFQDTDPLQYRIFRRIYPPAENCALFLIGDPKQAIYSFRGADIFTYMQAKADTGDRSTYTLGTNWRSAAGLVAAVNHLFSSACRPFVYDRDIPFFPVAAGPEADRTPLKIDGKVPAPLVFAFLEKGDLPATGNGAIKAETARDAAAAFCAGRIARLLALSRQGRATLGDAPLRAGDIAVLVRSHRDGLLMQEALRARAVASVSLSQQSVFETPEARCLQQVLLAVAEPGNENRLRAALATDWMGWRADQILTLDEDGGPEDVRTRFRAYRDLWLTRGFETAFLALIDREAVCRRLRAEPDGERRLTNLMHLGELLQAAARRCVGTEPLLRWLADQRNGGSGEDERLLRLESDEALVQIVTIHKSKGLEYPVVFIPFAWAGGKENRGPVLFHDPGPPFGAYLDFGSDDLDTHRGLAASEDLAERLRLFYVAVTRARHLCVLTWGRINTAERSAPAWLLHPDPRSDPPASAMKDLDEAAIRARLDDLAAGAGGTIAVETIAGSMEEGTPAPAEAPTELRARPFSGRIRRDWRLTSYSGLVAGTDAERPDYDAQPAMEQTVEPEAPVDPVFRFPRGTGPGQCLHELLEKLDFPTAAGAGLDQAIAFQLERYAIDGAWGATVAGLVGRVLDTPIDGGDLCLRRIARGDRLDEMEFHYPLAGLDSSGLGNTLAGFAAWRGTGDGLLFDPVRGLMKGFIDLVFRHRDRYYIVDYKSNHLGDRFDDYGPEQLKTAMAAHRYGLQYLVYTVALHRYLRHRLAGYDYRRHFGGVYYLFLRGMHPRHGASRGVFYDLPEPALIEALDALFAGRTLKAKPNS